MDEFCFTGLLLNMLCVRYELFLSILQATPQRQDDHGTIVFQWQPSLTMVGRVVTMVVDHGLQNSFDHGTQSTMVKNFDN